MREEWLTIALPKGKLGEKALKMLAEAGYPTKGIEKNSRKMVFSYPEEKVEYIICRPTDIPTYVDYGAADIGIAGKDSIVESNKDVFELVDLKFGYCKFVVAIPADKVPKGVQGQELLQHFKHARVATKFPRVAEMFFNEKGMQVEIIKLHGNIELAPMVNLADLIVDIVSTGTTLRENDLVAVDEIFSATARVIVNRASYRMKYEKVKEFAEQMKKTVRSGGCAK